MATIMMYKSLFILGRQPALGRAELESVLGAAHLARISDGVMVSDITPTDVPFQRLGGSIRLAHVLGELPSAQWPAIAPLLGEYVQREIDTLPLEGKIKLGLSTFDLPINERQLFRTGLEMKKVGKKAGRSVRLVPNTEAALSSAQVLHNQLTSELGIELLVIKNGTKAMLARTVAVQDITAYANRDQNRPKRDARVGMLPPKLAQIIVNLATGPLHPSPNTVVLDPFCGTGVVLQEAALMGYDMYGTDLEPRMIDYSRQNLEWLAERASFASPALEVGDATAYTWEHSFTAVASETYLGRPLSSWPNPETLHDIMGTCNVIIETFLKNIAGQAPSGTRFCLALPAWRSPGGTTKHLQLLDHLEKMGYNRVSFEYARDDELVYYRPEQLVARQLLVITRK